MTMTPSSATLETKVWANAASRHREEWRPIVGYEGRYEVSSLGRVRSLSRVEHYLRLGVPSARRIAGKILKPMMGHDGYPQISLRIGRKLRTVRVNRIVCEAFRGPPSILHTEAAHRNGQRDDCRAVNLKWASPAENTFHKRAHGTHQAGEKHPRALLTWGDVRAIRSARGAERGNDLAARYGVSRHTIYDIWRNVSWKVSPDFRKGEVR